LLLISTEEKKLRIVVGYGMESIVPDAVAMRIVEEIRPYVNEGDFYTAIKTFYELVGEKIAVGDVQFTNEPLAST